MHPLRFQQPPQRRRTAWAAALAALLGSGHALAFDIDTGHPDLTLRWDNSLRASTKFRTQDADPALKDSLRLLVPGVPASAFPQALNFNAGDQNFQNKGLVSARMDLLSEMDLVWRKDFGLRLSAAAWYDQKLHRSTQADNDATLGQHPYNEFPARTRRVAGGDGEVLDAFVFGGWQLGQGMKLTARLGQHALQYGESLFFGDNGIARAQGPVDIDKLLASPNAQFKEIIRPVPQLSAQLQISPALSLGAYVQFRWEADRLPPAGSYFSTANIPWGSSQTESVNIPAGPIAGNYLLSAGQDQKPRHSGQFGLQLKWRLDETDLGFYFARYHDKGGQLYGALDPTGTLSPFGTLPGQWYYAFGDKVRTYGVSATRTVGDFNFAGEVSVRENAPLRSANMLYPAPFAPQPAMAKGRTAHINLSTLASFGPSFLARESTLVAELAWNRVLSKTDPDGELDAGRTRDAAALQFIFTPSYRQVMPGLDLAVPIGARYTLAGHSAATVWDAKGSGNLSLGLEGTYLGSWQFALSYTHYLGQAVPFVDYAPLLAGGSAIYGHGNPLADRNFVALSLRRTF